MRDMIPAALIAMAAAAPAAAQTERGPDAHIVRPPRGDVIEVIDVRGEPASPCGKGGRSAYAAPVRGWKYKPVAPGTRLGAAFYAARYAIAAPSGLPAARGSRRWIRYGDDAVLVDTRSGRVLKVLAGRCC